MNDCEATIRPALREALNSFEIESDDNNCLVTTPFQHENGDLISVWLQSKQSEYYVIRDYGETFAMLRLYGVDPESDSRKKRIDKIRSKYNLESRAGEIYLRAHEDELGERIIDAIQATQAISHLTYTHTSHQPSRFKNEVEAFLRKAGYDIEMGYSVVGETHPREFDIGINHREPAVLLDTVHSTNSYNLRQQVDKIMLNWHEIQSTDFSHGAVVDDVDGEFDEEIMEQATDNLDYFFQWSEKERIPQEIPIEA